MPYINYDRRAGLIPYEQADIPDTAGELNFVLTAHIIEYVEKHGLSYKIINDVLGALDGASKEFYRRVAVPYEDNKIKENGDVYESIG